MIARSAASNLSSQWKQGYPFNSCVPGADEPPRGRILVVEDQAIVALDLQRTLREARYRVVGPAATPSAVESLLARGTVDAAIVDADAGTAFAVADRLAVAGVPILFLTSNPDMLPRQHAGGLVIAKPIAKPQLIEAIEGIVAGRRMADTEDFLYPVAPPPISWPRVFPQL